MKKLLLLLLFPFLLQAQKTTHNITFDGLSRKFIQYIPSTYDGTSAIPLLFSLHGFGDGADNFSNVGFEQISESENFIVITPEAIEAIVFGTNVGTAWNSGAGIAGITLNSTVQDVDFIKFLIDSVSNHYNIDPNRVYATGFSMGGFMANRLACELNDKIAAIGSVAGTIGSALTCTPNKVVPVIHFHGTEDGTVAYTGNLYGSDAEDLVSFWADNNNCDASPVITNVPDVAADGYTITKSVYSNCDADLEFYKVTNGPHEWFFTPTNDIDYSTVIWEFLSRQTLGGCTPPSINLGADIVLNVGQTTTLNATTTGATYLWNTGATTSTIVVTTEGTYSVTVTVDGCSASDDIHVDFVTGVFNQNNGFVFNVYPNPSNGKGMISLQSKLSGALDWSLYALDGQLIFHDITQLTIGNNSIPFNIENIAKGVYLLKLDAMGNHASMVLTINE